MVFPRGDRRHTGQSCRHIQGGCLCTVAQNSHRAVCAEDDCHSAACSNGDGIGDEITREDEGLAGPFIKVQWVARMLLVAVASPADDLAIRLDRHRVHGSCRNLHNAAEPGWHVALLLIVASPSYDSAIGFENKGVVAARREIGVLGNGVCLRRSVVGKIGWCKERDRQRCGGDLK